MGTNVHPLETTRKADSANHFHRDPSTPRTALGESCIGVSSSTSPLTQLHPNAALKRQFVKPTADCQILERHALRLEQSYIVV